MAVDGIDVENLWRVDRNKVDGMSPEEVFAILNAEDDSGDDEFIELRLVLGFDVFNRDASAFRYLNRAVSQATRWINTSCQEHPDYSRRVQARNFLAFSRDTHADKMRLLEDVSSIRDPEALNTHLLKLGIDIMQDILLAYSFGPSPRVAILSRLGNWLSELFQRTGRLYYINQAVEITNRAMSLLQAGQPERACLQSNLGNKLTILFEWTGAMSDIDKAIGLLTEVLVTEAPGPDHPGRLSNLAGAWGKRFRRTGDMDDLNRSIELSSKAVNWTGENDPELLKRITNHGILLGERFSRTQSLADIDTAVHWTKQAVDSTPCEHPHHLGHLHNYSSMLRLKHASSLADSKDYLNDIDDAIEAYDKAIKLAPHKHPERAWALHGLGAWLSARFEICPKIGDLNRAIEVTRDAVQATNSEYSPRAMFLLNLGQLHLKRHERKEVKEADDWGQALSSFREGMDVRTAAPSIRVYLSSLTAGCLASEERWEEAGSLLHDAVCLLPKVCPRSLKQVDQQYMLATFAQTGIASMAAAVALEAKCPASEALQLLELGRGVIASFLLETQTDVSDLQQLHPELAVEFTALRDKLDSPTGSLPPTLFSETDQQFDAVIEAIRDKPDFEHFLLPPSADDLMSQANHGPVVVINISAYRSDAFLVESDKIRVLPLKDLAPNEIEKYVALIDRGSASLDPVLAWLWDTTVNPILSALGFLEKREDNWPRVWWIPTGLMCRLPIHAAGHHYVGEADTVLDRVISSYSSSIQTLRHVRNLAAKDVKCVNPEKDLALLVCMRTTPQGPGLRVPDLAFAEREIDTVISLLPHMRQQVLNKPVKASVLREIRSCAVFHFAGHAQTDPSDPSKSRLLLHDWEDDPLTVTDIMRLRLSEQRTRLSYLSACTTGQNRTRKLQDEAIHLMNACQLAGIPHVIGSLWEVDDKFSMTAAREVYSTIRDRGWGDNVVSLAVHQAARFLRRDSGRATRGVRYATRYGGDPSIWASYFHVGP